MSYKCKNCGRKLTALETAIHKKFINRGATEFMCKTCLAKFFDCTEEMIDEKVEQFKEMGCSLFV